MKTLGHRIEENDVVALRERVAGWAAGTVGTAVRFYDAGALIEVSDDATGEALEMFDVPSSCSR